MKQFLKSKLVLTLAAIIMIAAAIAIPLSDSIMRTHAAEATSTPFSATITMAACGVNPQTIATFNKGDVVSGTVDYVNVGDPTEANQQENLVLQETNGSFTQTIIIDSGTQNISFTAAADSDSLTGCILPGVDGNAPDGDEQATITGTVTSAPPTKEADLSITKTDSSHPVAVGHGLTYTVTVTNSGPDTATGVRVTDMLPKGLRLLTLPKPSQGACSALRNGILCLIGSLANGTHAKVFITAIAEVKSTITNTASVQGNEADPNQGNNTASVTSNVVSPPPALKQESAGCDLKMLVCTIILNHDTAEILGSAIAGTPISFIPIQAIVLKVCTPLVVAIPHKLIGIGAGLVCGVLIELAIFKARSLASDVLANNSDKGVIIRIKLSFSLTPISFTVKPR